MRNLNRIASCMEESMIESFLQELSTRDLENDDNLSLLEMREENNTLILTFKLQSDFNEDEKIQIWKIECQEFIQRNIQDDIFNSFTIFKEHVLLWGFIQSTCKLYFKGLTENVSGLIGELYLKHLEITGNWIPFDEYLNDMMDIRNLLNGGSGLVAEGPGMIIEEYSKVLNKFNISTSMISDGIVRFWNGCNWVEGSYPYSILIFGRSFVIAKEFIEERIQ